MTKGKQVLIIDDVHEMLIDGLKQIGYEVIYLPDATRIDLLHHITTAIGLVVRTKTQIDAEVINKGYNLKFIARAGAGLDKRPETINTSAATMDGSPTSSAILLSG